MINSHANLAKNAKRTFTQQCEKFSFISLNARASLVLAYWIGAARTPFDAANFVRFARFA